MEITLPEVAGANFDTEMLQHLNLSIRTFSDAS